MPISNAQVLQLIQGLSGGGGAGSYGGGPRTIRDLYADEERLRTLAARIQREQAPPTPPLTAAGEPFGGTGGYGDIEAGIQRLSATVPERAAAGPIWLDKPAPLDTDVLTERANRLRGQRYGQIGQGIAGAITPFINFAFSGPRVTSSKDRKKDLRGRSDAKTLREIMDTPAVSFRYKGESDGAPKRTGVIAEEAPDQMTNADKTMVNLPEWVQMLRASVRELAREVEALKRRT